MQLDLVDKKILGFLQEDNKQTNKLTLFKIEFIGDCSLRTN